MPKMKASSSLSIASGSASAESNKTKRASIDQMTEIVTLTAEIKPYTDFILELCAYNLGSLSVYCERGKTEDLSGVTQIVADIVLYLPRILLMINKETLKITEEIGFPEIFSEGDLSAGSVVFSSMLFINLYLLSKVSKPLLNFIFTKMNVLPSSKLIEKYQDLSRLFTKSTLDVEQADQVIQDLKRWKKVVMDKMHFIPALSFLIDGIQGIINFVRPPSGDRSTRVVKIFSSGIVTSLKIFKIIKFYLFDPNKQEKNYHRFLENLITSELRKYRMFTDVMVENKSNYQTIFLLKINFSQQIVMANLLSFIFEQVGLSALQTEDAIYVYFSRDQARANMKKLPAIEQQFSAAVQDAITRHQTYLQIDSASILGGLRKLLRGCAASSDCVVEEIICPEQCMGDKHYVIKIDKHYQQDFIALTELCDDYLIEEDEVTGLTNLHIFINSADRIAPLHNFVSQQIIVNHLRKVWLLKLAALAKQDVDQYHLEIDEDSHNYIITGPMKKEKLTQLLQVKEVKINFAAKFAKMDIDSSIKLDRIEHLAARLDVSLSSFMGISSHPASFHRSPKKTSSTHENQQNVASTSGAQSVIPTPARTYSIVLQGKKKQLAATEVLSVSSNYGFNGYGLIYWSADIKARLTQVLGDEHPILVALTDSDSIPAVGPRGEFGVVRCKNVQNGYMDGHPVAYKFKIKGPGQDRIFLSPCTFFTMKCETEEVKMGLIPTAVGRHNKPLQSLMP